MKNFKKILIIAGLVFGMGILFTPISVGAAGTSAVPSDACTNNPTSELCQHSSDDLMGYVTKIINALMFVLGAVSVVMIILGGIKYTTSMGDAKNVESAKNTIMYAVIGLIVAILAAAIVNFVIGRLVTTS